MEIGQAAFVDNIHRALEHLIRLGREACNQVCTEYNVRAKFTCFFAKRYGIVAQMPPLQYASGSDRHRLHRQMQMRHKAWLLANAVKQGAIDLDLVD